MDINFARTNWEPTLFTPEQVEGILTKMKRSPPSQIEFLDSVPLLQVLDANPCFFGKDGFWNLFPILSLPLYVCHSVALYTWVDQVKLYAATDDLLFYRLAYLSWYNQILSPKFTNTITELLKKSSQTEFRKLVLNYYSQEKNTKRQKSFMELPVSVLEENPTAQATLHFEHFLSAFIMGYKVPAKKIGKLLRKFEPSLISPFLCRSLLENLNDYCGFMTVLNKSLPEWKEEYTRNNAPSLYFPARFLPVDIQAKLWRDDRLTEYFEAVKTWRPRSSYPPPFKQYIGDEYRELEKKVSIEKNGFTFIDCSATEEEIIKFIKGRMVESLWNKRRLPRFIPLLQEYSFMDTEWYKGRIKERLLDDLCIEKSKKITHEDANRHFNTIKSVFTDWKVPTILFASI